MQGRKKKIVSEKLKEKPFTRSDIFCPPYNRGSRQRYYHGNGVFTTINWAIKKNRERKLLASTITLIYISATQQDMERME